MKRRFLDPYVVILFLVVGLLSPVMAGAGLQRAQIIRFLGVSVARDVRDMRQGAVGELVVGWEERSDQHGIIVSFLEGPVRSARTQNLPSLAQSTGPPERPV
ncbi:hypothetical protein [Nitrospira sp. Nam80]